MHREIDKNVDAPLTNEGREIVIGEARRFVPGVGVRTQAAGHRIGGADVAEAVDLELLVVVMGQQRREKDGDRMLAEIGGDVADPQTTIGRGIVVVRRDIGGQGPGESLVPSRVRLEDLERREVGMKVHQVEQVAGEARVRGAQVGGGAVVGACLFEPASVF